MGDLLLHATVVWINPPSSLMKGKKDPELAAFGKCASVCVDAYVCFEGRM